MGDAQDRRIHDSTSTMVIKTAVAPFRRAPSAEKMAATFVIFQVPNIASDLLIVGFKVFTRRSRTYHIASEPVILFSSCRTKKKQLQESNLEKLLQGGRPGAKRLQADTADLQMQRLLFSGRRLSKCLKMGVTAMAESL